MGRYVKRTSEIISGVYAFKNKVNGKYYIGESKDILGRKSEHLQKHSWKTYQNKILYKGFIKYGIENFDFIILEKVANVKLRVKRELFWKTKLKSVVPNGYNMIPGKELGGPTMFGENHPNSKLSDKEVLEIKGLLINSYVSMKDIGIRFNIASREISSINTGKSWFNKNTEYPIRKNERSLLGLEIIKLLLEDSLIQKDIAIKLKTSRSKVSQINTGSTMYDNEIKYPITKNIKYNLKIIGGRKYE